MQVYAAHWQLKKRVISFEVDCNGRSLLDIARLQWASASVIEAEPISGLTMITPECFNTVRLQRGCEVQVQVAQRQMEERYRTAQTAVMFRRSTLASRSRWGVLSEVGTASVSFVGTSSGGLLWVPSCSMWLCWSRTETHLAEITLCTLGTPEWRRDSLPPLKDV